MSDEQTLTDRLAEAARAAVEKRRAAIEAGATNLRAVLVEIELSNNGAVLDVTTHLSWRSVVRDASRAGR